MFDEFFIGKFDLNLLKNGTPLKRKEWGGYCKWENDTIMMYCKNGRIVDICNNGDICFTIYNILKEDWEIATDANCSIEVK